MTAHFAGAESSLVCRTRDVSTSGVFLETPVPIDQGTEVALSLLDEERGEALELEGVVTRLVPPSAGGAPGGLGVHVVDPPDAWKLLVDRLVKRQDRDRTMPLRAPRRLRVLVVGDDDRRRGALALYVQSGWDVRFASDLAGTEEALAGYRIDAVIAEHDLDDARWPQVLDAVKRAQPAARRIVRTPLRGRPAPPRGGPGDLVQWVVDHEAGLDALLDALTAE